MAVRLPNALLVPALVLGAVALAHAGDLYQWKDGRGVTHYSDAPPPKGNTYRSRSIRDQAPTPVAVDAKPAPPANINCTLARANLEHLKTGGNIGIDANRDGKPDSLMSADEQARQRQLAEQNIKTYCTPTATVPAT